MPSRAGLAWSLLDSSRRMLRADLRDLKPEEALAAAGGYRSMLGIRAHSAAFSHAYHSCAFEEAPRHLDSVEWPRGLRDTVDAPPDYLDEVVSWSEAAADAWRVSHRRPSHLPRTGCPKIRGRGTKLSFAAPDAELDGSA